MIYDFDTLPNRRASESIKWLAYNQEVLPMWVADMDFLSPQPVIQTLKARAEHGVFGYPKELPELREAIIERMGRLYQWQVEPQAIVPVPGVVTGLHLASQAVNPGGGGVLVQTPVYPPFLTIAKTAGMTHQEMELTRLPDGSYEIDYEAFEAAITEQTCIFILCNPHNPVGRVFRQEELERMAEICLRRGLVICSDEIHCDLVFTGYQHIPIAALDSAIASRTITLMAPSKTYNLAGLEYSFAIIPDHELRKTFQEARRGLVGWPNLMGQVAAQAAYQHGQEWLDQLLIYLEANRDYLYEKIRQEMPAIHMASPEGTYLAWLDCRELKLPSSPYEFFLEKGRVAFNDGATFGTGGEGFVRLNFGCPRSMLDEAIQRMRNALEALA